MHLTSENSLISSSGQQTPPTLFKPLTGIRAVAAGWVVCGHFGPQLGVLFPAVAVLFPIIHSGYLGVDLFFVLSGFILAHTHLAEFKTIRFSQYGRFLWLRLARLYPVHIFCLLLLASGLLASRVGGLHINMPERLGAADFARNLALVHAWGFGDDTSWNGPAWSISAEWFAYLLFPLIAFGVVRLRSAAAAVAISIALYAILLASFSKAGTTWTTLANDLALVRVGTQFLVGCLLYRVYTAGWRNGAAWEAIAWLLAIAMVVYSFVFPPERFTSLIPAPLMAGLVLALASAKGPIARFLSSRIMVFGGEVSYSLYMTHDLLRMALNKLLNADKFAGSSPSVRAAVLLVYVACILGMAIGTYFIVEKPARRWLRGVIGRGRPIDEAELKLANPLVEAEFQAEAPPSTVVVSTSN